MTEPPHTRTQTYQQLDGREEKCQLEWPTTCPRCGRGIDAQPIKLAEYLNGIAYPITHTNGYQWIQAGFRCPHHDCLRYFIGEYHRHESKSTDANGSPRHHVYHKLDRVLPVERREHEFPAIVKAASPQFSVIVNRG